MASKSRMLNADRSTWTFNQMLDWHLVRGTRPDSSPAEQGVPWQNKEFANAVGKHSTEGPKNERTIRNWRNGQTTPSPADLNAMRLALFGGNPIYTEWRAELTEKYPRGGEDHVPSTPAELTTSLPTKPLRCIGRDDDLNSVVGALIAERDDIAVLVLGGPGMGKTTLTRQAAVDPKVSERFGQRRWFVELETAANAEALEKAIIDAIGLDPASARFDDALARLAHAPGLLVLDNLETPWDGEREKVEALLDALHHVAGLAILASIRGNDSPAAVRWTRRRTMHPLESPHDQEMFLDIAVDIKPDDPSLALLLAELGGVPIAIELVAQLATAHDSLSAIYEEWKRVGIALAQRRGIEPSRLSSLEVSLELSFQSPRLGNAGRGLFGILGQLPAGIAADDLNVLLGNSAFDARQGLLSSGLCFERSGRLDLLPPVRDHARRLHPPEGCQAKAWWAHLLALAARSEVSLRSDGGSVVQRLGPELPNLDAAVRAAIVANDLKPALTALPTIADIMFSAGLGTGSAIQELATASRLANDVMGEANCVRSLGDIALARSDHEVARRAYEQSLSLYEQVNDVNGKATCIARLGEIALRRSDHDNARKAYEQASPLFHQIDNKVGEANCILHLGEIVFARSDSEVARQAYEQALALYRQVGDILGEANCILRLGEIALRHSDHDAARNAYEQALPLYRQVGDIRGEANSIQALGDIALARADYEAARKAYERALPLFRQVGAALGEANCIQRLGDITLARSDDDAARKAYEQALTLYRQVGDLLGEANCITSLGDIARQRSDHEAARKAYDDALPLYRQVGDLLGEANCITSLGDIALARSDHEAARQAYDQALPLYQRNDDPYSIGIAHLTLANISKGAERTRHRAAAREAWLSIGREDLVKKHGLSK